MPNLFPIDRKSIVSFVRLHPWPLITIAAVLAILLVYHFNQRQQAFPEWETNRASPAGHSGNDDGNSNESEQNSQAALWDPESPQVDAKYKLPAKLSSDETHQLILNMECLVDLAGAHDELFADYDKLYILLTNPAIQDVIFTRVRNRQGFKQTDLPLYWQQFSDEGPFHTYFDALKTDYVRSRVGQIRSRILGARYTTGDVRFVDYATNSYVTDFPRLGGWVKKAAQVQRWLIEDAVLTPDSLIHTSIDGVNDYSEMIAVIRNRHLDAPSTGLPPTVRVDPNGGAKLVANLTPDERTNLLKAMQRLAPEMVGGDFWFPDEADLHYVRPEWDDSGSGPHKLKISHPNAADIWNFMRGNGTNADPDRDNFYDREPLITQEMRTFLIRRTMFISIGENLSAWSVEDNVADWPKTQALYNRVINCKLPNDKQREGAIAQMLLALKDRKPTRDSFSVREVDSITIADKWVTDTLSKYGEDEKMMDDLWDSLRHSTDSRIQHLVDPYVCIPEASGPLAVSEASGQTAWLIDPFSRSPSDLISTKRVDAYSAYRRVFDLPHIKIANGEGI